MVKLIILFTVSMLCINVSNAKISEEEVSFLNSVFKDDIPKKKRLIVKKDAQENIKKIMGDTYNKRLFSYWEKNDNKVWILNSIGKYKPITAGFVVNDCKIKSSHVIVYREAHGYEIKFPSFLLQFTDAEIDDNMKLNLKVDNISGATLSVNSMQRMAKTALLLTKLLNDDKCA